jgi:hypothetical protein
MEPVQIGNILISHDRLVELDESRIVASVSRESFRSGEIKVARLCKRPYILTLLALGMIALGSLTARGLVEWLLYGGTIYDVSMMMVLMIPSGAWLLYQAWRHAPMVLIETDKGTVRLEFKGPRTQDTVDALERAARERGYVLQRGSAPW